MFTWRNSARIRVEIRSPRAVLDAGFRRCQGSTEWAPRARGCPTRRRPSRWLGCDFVAGCPPGGFADRMRCAASVLPVDLEDEGRAVDTAVDAGPFDLVHAHPWASFRVGTEAATRLGARLMVTRHNLKLNDLPARIRLVDLIVTVSEHVRRAVVERLDVPAERVVAIPNGIDTRRFKPSRARPRAGRHPGANVLVASRFDEDKHFLVELLISTWRSLAEDTGDVPAIRWTIAGEGSRVGELQEAAARTWPGTATQPPHFTGWLGPANSPERYVRPTLLWRLDVPRSRRWRPAQRPSSSVGAVTWASWSMTNCRSRSIRTSGVLKRLGGVSRWDLRGGSPTGTSPRRGDDAGAGCCDQAHVRPAFRRCALGPMVATRALPPAETPPSLSSAPWRGRA